ALAVLPPAAVLALASGGSFAMAASILAIGVATGLLWASMPPWTMLLMINLGLFARWLPEPIAAALAELLRSPAGLGMVALGILLACAFCWLWMPPDPEGGSPWQVPVAVQLGRGSPFASNAGQQAGALTPHTPVGRDLARVLEQALGIALGPGFGRNSARNLLVAQAPVLVVMLLWLLLGAVAVGGKLNMALVLAPTLVFASGMTPLARLLVLFWQPRQGLHELALLPGLPPQPVPALARALAKQVPVRALPALALVLAVAAASGAGAEY